MLSHASTGGAFPPKRSSASCFRFRLKRCVRRPRCLPCGIARELVLNTVPPRLAEHLAVRHPALLPDRPLRGWMPFNTLPLRVRDVCSSQCLAACGFEQALPSAPAVTRRFISPKRDSLSGIASSSRASSFRQTAEAICWSGEAAPMSGGPSLLQPKLMQSVSHPGFGMASPFVPTNRDVRGPTSCSPETQSRQGTAPSGRSRQELVL